MSPSVNSQFYLMRKRVVVCGYAMSRKSWRLGCSRHVLFRSHVGLYNRIKLSCWVANQVSWRPRVQASEWQLVVPLTDKIDQPSALTRPRTAASLQNSRSRDLCALTLTRVLSSHHLSCCIMIKPPDEGIYCLLDSLINTTIPA